MVNITTFNFANTGTLTVYCLFLDSQSFFVGEILTVEALVDRAAYADKQTSLLFLPLLKNKNLCNWSWVDRTIKQKLILNILTFWLGA